MTVPFVPFPVVKERFQLKEVPREKKGEVGSAINLLLGTYVLGGRSAADYFGVSVADGMIRIQPKLQAGIDELVLKEGVVPGVAKRMGPDYCQIRLGEYTFQIAYHS